MHATDGMTRIAMRQAYYRVRGYAVQRMNAAMRSTEKKSTTPVVTEIEYPRRIFSGIQPTGSLHLGNYLGAVKKWTELQNQNGSVAYCIVDMHSITTPQDPAMLRENILKMAATMLACGINPEKSIVFVQSSVKEHTELSWILNCLSTMARLGHLPQYKEKTRSVKDIPLGIFVYPVLQAADIMLYKSTHVPVGEDQVQHIQLAQHLAKTFNTRFGQTFPICHAIVEDSSASRIRSLRDPTKKMSKSDPDPKATVNIMDEPEAITEKVKKAMTDFISDVNYDPARRSGVSNLIAIHSLVTKTPIEKIVEEAKSIDTGKYKLRVADAVIAHLTPIRNNVAKQLANPKDLIHMLERGAKKARAIAGETIAEVHQKMGLGIEHRPMPQQLEEPHKATSPNTRPINDRHMRHRNVSLAAKYSQKASAKLNIPMEGEVRNLKPKTVAAAVPPAKQAMPKPPVQAIESVEAPPKAEASSPLPSASPPPPPSSSSSGAAAGAAAASSSSSSASPPSTSASSSSASTSVDGSETVTVADNEKNTNENHDGSNVVNQKADSDSDSDANITAKKATEAL